MARAVANHMTRDRSGGEVRPAWVVTAWANVNGPGNSNFRHYHPGSFWSGTYYVDTGGDPVPGAWRRVRDAGPAGRGSGDVGPHPGLRRRRRRGCRATESIEPRAGLLFLFPSWLHHQVRAYNGQGTRISIAFNMRI